MMIDSIAVASAATAKIMEKFIEYRQTKKADELATTEWKKLEQAYTSHLEWRFRYPERVFKEQRIWSWIITVLVIVIVGVGLFFSYNQLNWALKVGDVSALKTELDIDKAGKLSFRSSLVGATVLIISLVFFYLYLRHVFEIKHLIPPHVSFADTDVVNLLGHSKDKDVGELVVKKEKAQEKDSVADK